MKPEKAKCAHFRRRIVLSAAILSLAAMPHPAAAGTRFILLDPGYVELTSPMEIDAGDGVVLAGRGPGRTVLSGARRLDRVSFERGADGVWSATIGEAHPIDTLWIDGRRMDMARFPNRRSGGVIFGTWRLDDGGRRDKASDPLDAGRVARWRNPAGAYFHALHAKLWGDMHWRVTGKNDAGGLTLEGGWQNNRPTAPHPRYRFIENVREELDAPGEWFYDAAAGRLMVIPFVGQRLDCATVEYSRLATLVRIAGVDASRPAGGVVVSNIVFTGTTRTFMENKERMFRSDWTICRKAALEFENARDCLVTDCDFRETGGNAVTVGGYASGIVVTNCLFAEVGANGIVFAGKTNCVRNPLFDYSSVPDYERLDRTPGPASEDYPRDGVVADSLFTRTGRHEKQTAPVTVFAARRISISECTMFDVPRAAVNIGTGAFGGHVVERCDMFDTVKETGDHGSFNSWGRDRFWAPSLSVMDSAVSGDLELMRLDACETTVLRGNRIRCDHGWDIDLDDGSSRYLIEDNFCLKGGIKLREGYSRIVRGNYVLNNGLHPHCWLRDSQDVVTNNVFFAPPRPAGRMAYWGRATSPNTMASVPPPPYPKGRYGVRSPRLRELSREPDVDAPRVVAVAQGRRPVKWRGMSVRRIDPANEFSAFGTTPDMAGFVIEGAASAPFEPGDLVLGGKLPAPGAATVEVVRSQRRLTLELR